MPIDSHNEAMLEQIRQAKEAYLLVLRQAFFDGLDPLMVWESAIHGDASSAQLPVPDDIPAKLGELVLNATY